MVEVLTAEVPPLAEGEVRVSVTYCGVCGTDLHMLRLAEHVGLVLGHEIAGVVAEVGPGVAGGWRIGERVAVLPMAECGQCDACRDGGGVCFAGLMQGPGQGRQGGFADSVALPSQMLVRVPDGLSDVAAAIAEPLAVAVRAVNRSTARPDDAVCVLGAGPIGCMTVVALQARSFRNVLVVEPNAARAETARSLGVTTCSSGEAADVAERVLGRQPRVVIDCTGHPSGGELGISLLPQSGHLVVVGATRAPVTADFWSVTIKELTVTGSLAYSRKDFDEALDDLASGRIPVQRIVTSIRPLDEANAVMQELSSERASEIKVLLRP
jgi:2-desacetyl-2-hydroxyethyl bacteriochlorophyllide A dehydrogenase